MRKRYLTPSRLIPAGGFVIGVFWALCCGQGLTVSSFAGGFAHAFPARFSLQALRDALLLQLLPLLLICLDGWFLLCRPFGTALLTLRALLAGAGCTLFYRMLPDKGLRWIVFAFFALFELLTLSVWNSMLRLSALFCAAARKGVGRRTVSRYLKDQFFFIGLSLILYLMRGAAVLLIVRPGGR